MECEGIKYEQKSIVCFSFDALGHKEIAMLWGIVEKSQNGEDLLL